MKINISLRLFVTLTFLLLSLALVVGYSLLSADYFIRGMDNITALHMERAAQEYLKSKEKQHSLPGDIFGYRVFQNWESLPESIRLQFTTVPERDNTLYKSFLEKDENSAESGPPLTFLFRYHQGGNNLYVTHQVSPDAISALVKNNGRESRRKLLTISLISALSLTIIIWLLFKRISGPVNQLLNWTRGLTPATIKGDHPDFRYPELNHLATIIIDSFTSVQQSLDREHRFLRHTSHELRTPISVIRNNMELLRKLRSDAHQSGPQNDELQQSALERLDRASLTMKHLTETLLWLSRESVDDLPSKPVSLDWMILQLTEEMNYLLIGKPVSTNIKTQPHTQHLPEIAVRIVVGNLIRNAYQHCLEGSVQITQQGPKIEIVNPREERANSSDLGFGLGLDLTEQLCQKLGWSYKSGISDQHHYASVTFPQI